MRGRRKTRYLYSFDTETNQERYHQHKVAMPEYLYGRVVSRSYLEYRNKISRFYYLERELRVRECLNLLCHFSREYSEYLEEAILAMSQSGYLRAGVRKFRKIAAMQ